MRFLPVALFALLFVPLQGFAATIRVPADQPTIQAGIAAASAGDTVLVSCGTYHERNIDLKSGVALLSETGQPDCAVIDAQGSGRVLNCWYLDSAIVEGLTLRGGNAVSGSAGGISCTSSSLAMTNCMITGNRADVHAGGMSVWNDSRLVITNCTFSNNSAAWGGGMSCGYGGSAILSNCTFSDNAVWFGAGLGGGLFLGSEGSTLTGCVFSGNSSPGSGGGLFCNQASPTIESCTFYGNEAPRGAAIDCYDGSSPALYRTIVAGNDGGEGISCTLAPSNLTLTCCDVYGNAGGDWVGCIADQDTVRDNFSAEPIFCGPEMGDFHLDAASPCLDHAGCGPVGALGEGCSGFRTDVPGEGAVPFSWSLVKHLFEVPRR